MIDNKKLHMATGRPDLIRNASDQTDCLERAFRSGSAIIFPWNSTVAELASAIRTVERYLSTLPIETSFHGTDGLEADRQSLWVRSTGLRRPLHNWHRYMAKVDGL